MQFRLGDKEIDSALILELVKAVNEPVMSAPTLENLRITQEWLAKNHDGPSSHIQGGAGVDAPNQKALYRDRFEDPEFILPIVSGIYTRSFHTDDYPSIEVQVLFEDSSMVTLQSESQQPFMLPWIVSGADGKQTTFNANISRAFLPLLPKKFTNRDRISGEGLLEELKKDVDQILEPELNLLDANNRARSTLDALKNRFVIREAEINGFHHPEYGTAWSGDQPHETNLHVTLETGQPPSNTTVALVLEFKDGRVEGLDNFLGSINKNEELLASLPWLHQYIRSHRDVPIRISFVHNASFGDKALSVFEKDMHALKKDDLAQKAASEQLAITLLIAGGTYAESYWLIFPDKQMLLWRYNGPSGLLKWKPADFVTGECSAYGPPSGGCVGALVDPNGNLVP